jgi:hypothetical protein
MKRVGGEWDGRRVFTPTFKLWIKTGPFRPQVAVAPERNAVSPGLAATRGSGAASR